MRPGRTNSIFSLLIACMVMASCAAPPAANETKIPILTDTPEASSARFTITTDTKGNELTVSAQGETTVIEVHSQNGIGSAFVEMVSGPAPEKIVLRLHLPGLEQLRLSYGGRVVTASVSSSDAENIIEGVASTGGGEQTIAPGSPSWLNIQVVSAEDSPRIPLEQGYFEVTLPKDILENGDGSFSIEWIDFYR